MLSQTLNAWQEDHCSQLAAALAFYTVFSLAPLLILLVAAIGAVYGREAARNEVEFYLTKLVGPQMADLTSELIAAAARRKSLGTAVGGLTMLMGATVVFAELQTALNRVWGVRTKPGRRVWRFVRRRLLSFLIILLVGAVLFASLVASTALSGFKRQLGTGQLPEGWLILGNIGVSLFVSWLVFALIFHFLPDVRSRWRYDLVGAFVTAVLFNAGKELISLYLARSVTASPYGAAGTLFAFLVWLYYSSQIFFLGAEFTKAYSLQQLGRTEPNADAVAVRTVWEQGDEAGC